MKKNAMLKIAAILMVAVLLTTCAISSTFAKYTTTGPEVSDSARVAKWGVEIKTDISDLFAAAYDTEAGEEAADIDVFENEGTDTIEIKYGAEDVLAPGTSGKTELKNTVTGTPEVSVAISMKATLTLTGWEVDVPNTEGGSTKTPYCPLTFTVDGATYSIEDATADNVCTDIADLKAKVEAAIVAASKAEYKAGTDLSTVDETNFVIAWEWAFDVDDTKDTLLGNLADDGKAATVTLTVQQTIEQIDAYPSGN